MERNEGYIKKEPVLKTEGLSRFHLEISLETSLRKAKCVHKPTEWAGTILLPGDVLHSCTYYNDYDAGFFSPHMRSRAEESRPVSQQGRSNLPNQRGRFDRDGRAAIRIRRWLEREESDPRLWSDQHTCIGTYRYQASLLVR